MRFPENYILERRPVKRWRIRISQDGTTSVVVPLNFSDADLSDLLRAKKGWIEKKQDEFSRRARKIELESDQLLFLGEPYRYIYEANRKRSVAIDHEMKIIRAEADLLNPEIQQKWHKSEAKKRIVERTETLARLHNFAYNRIFIRDQRTRWGSCSGRKNLSFNWRLIKAPGFALDYVILHELVHTEIMNHSREFYAKLESVCPNFRQALEWMDSRAHNL